MTRIFEKVAKKLGRNDEPAPTPDVSAEAENSVMLEAFEWYSPTDGQHWKRLKTALPRFKEVGIQKVWIPPACKAGHSSSNGYDIYDLYDLGEFDQKGSVATKWGTKTELQDLGRAAKALEIDLIFDAVLGHRAFADSTQRVKAQRVDPENRLKSIGEAQEIDAWLKFDYEGRAGKYSSMRYNADHFNGTDYDDATKSTGIFRLAGKEWAKDANHEKGNYDYLLCNNLDLSHPEVRSDAQQWAKWVAQQVDLGGFRLDAAKHMSQSFMKDFVKSVRESFGRDWMLVGEYAVEDDVKVLVDYLKKMNGSMSLFDFPLVRNLTGIANHDDADLRFVFGDTLCEKLPNNAVSFVGNHDKQERENMEEPRIEGNFLLCAYAITLLNAQAGYPCVFWGHLFGCNGPNGSKPAAYAPQVLKLLQVRKLCAYGSQANYMDDPKCIGFTRPGRSIVDGGVAVVISKSKDARQKRMNMGKEHAGERWSEVFGNAKEHVQIDQNGWGVFPVNAAQGNGALSVWCNSAVAASGKLDGSNFDDLGT